MKFVYAFLIIFLVHTASSQRLNFGVGFGFNVRNNLGVNLISDSITVQAQGSRSMLNVYSAFMQYSYSKTLQLRTSINLTDQLNGFTLYNSKATCQFCNLYKAATVGSVNINMTNEIILRLPIRSIVKFNLIGGIRTNVNFTRNEPEVSFRNGTSHQGLAEVINHLDGTIKTLYFNSIIGAKLDWKKISLLGELDKNLGKSITSSINVFGEKYQFINRTNTFTLTLNYAIFPLKQKSKT